METLNIKKQVEVLNDLLQINNDRIAGYKRAIGELNDKEDDDLKLFFKKLINNSVDNNQSLERLIDLYNGEPSDGTSGAGKVFRAWMDIKTLFTGGDKNAILNSCETGEAAALRAYADALGEENLTAEVRKLISSQKEELHTNYTEVKALSGAST